ncbi:hypothetical protein [Myroides odoratus]|uniref:hypothetical protein n=1 Tax=Myroides odoratus TaxID=256 RepID=UPI0039B041BC
MGALEIDPMRLITAAANGQKNQEELQVIVRTLIESFTQGTTLLISSTREKVSQFNGEMDAKTEVALTFLRTILRLSKYCEKVCRS